MIEVSWGARTDVGRQRSVNEDAYLVRPPLFAVADGMGGHAAGDQASAITIDVLAEFAAITAPTRHDVLRLIRKADAAIVQMASDPSKRGMGTTVCIVALLEEQRGRALVANVGDSRVYLVGSDGWRQITRDHSLVQELLDAGSIDEAEVDHHPDRHVLTRSLGSGVSLEIDWWVVDAHRGERFVLASDGLTKELSPAEIVGIVSSNPDPQQAADRLVAAALDAGGRDNVTVVVVEPTTTVWSVVGDADPLDADTNPTRTRR